MVLSDNNTITQDNAKHKCIGRKWALKPIWPVKSKAQKIAIMGRNPKVNVDSVCSIIVLHESMVAGKGWRNQEGASPESESETSRRAPRRRWRAPWAAGRPTTRKTSARSSPPTPPRSPWSVSPSVTLSPLTRDRSLCLAVVISCLRPPSTIQN